MNKELEEVCQLNYETENKRMQEKISIMQEENVNKLRNNQQMWQQIVDDKDKEIHWLKSIINRILHI